MIEQRDPLRHLELQLDPQQLRQIQQAVEERVRLAVEQVLERPLVATNTTGLTIGRGEE
jgi:hypothetical protein